MNPRAAQRTVLAALVVLVLIRTVQNTREGRPLVAPRELFGALAAGMALAALSEWLPSAAAMLAVTAAITGTVQAGPALFQAPSRPALAGSPDSAAQSAGVPRRPLLP